MWLHEGLLTSVNESTCILRWVLDKHGLTSLGEVHTLVDDVTPTTPMF